MLAYLLIFCFGIYYLRQFVLSSRSNIPMVSGSVPFFGHGIQFAKNEIGFIKKCYAKYGKVFRIRLFSMDTAIICDRELTKEYFRSPETNLSLYDILDRIYFSDAFSSGPDEKGKLIQMVKLVKTSSMLQEGFDIKMKEEAEKMVKEIKEKKRYNLKDLMTRFIVSVTAKCMIGIPIEGEMYKTLLRFSQLLNKIIGMSYMLPKCMLGLIFNNKLKNYRKKITKELVDYLDDGGDSIIIRKAIEMGMSNEQIADVLVCLLYVATENTALAACAMLVDLSNNEKYWEMIRNDEKCGKDGKEGEEKKSNSPPLLNNCILESARMNSHILAINRKPRMKTLGGYYIGNVDCVALCESIFMIHDCEDIYQDALTYKPERFNDTSLQHTSLLMTWGSGLHLCPGKSFAIKELETVVSTIVKNFKPLSFTKLGKITYFSPAAISEREIECIFERI